MNLRVAVDFGTSSTCVAVSVGGREPQVVVVDGSPLMSSAIYAARDGTVFVGQEADRQAAVDPSRYEPHPKRRIDETELLLGASVLPVRQVIRSVLARAVHEARRVAGGLPVDQLVLTHPADWGAVRTRVLRQAAQGLGGHVLLIPEPVAAAVFHAASFPLARGRLPVLAVLDLGGGTVDVSVVRAMPAAPNSPQRRRGYQVLATRGDPTFGGADIDQLLLEHVGSVVSRTDAAAWQALVEGRDLPDRRRRRVIAQDVRGAKETLSRHTYTDVPMPPPFPDAHVTRVDLERLITEPIDRAARLVTATLRDAGLRAEELTGIFLVGGSSRIPLVSQLVHKRAGVVPTTLDQPETVVARGALRAVAETGERTGVVSAHAVAAADAPSVERPPAPSRPPVPPPVQPATPARPRPARRGKLLAAAGALVAVAAVAVALVITLGGDEETPPQGAHANTMPERTGRMISQYEYQFVLPSGWIQTGGDADKLRTEIKPTDAQSGTDLVLVEQIRLGFDSSADRDRAVSKLREEFDAAGANFTGFEEHASFAGRDVIHYRQRLVNANATVDWYVVFQGTAQVSIGCQLANEGGIGADELTSACETVVGSLKVLD
jgi:molecular chaperone DnaK